MAVLVKWLTRWIVAPVCMGSIPIYRPICENKRTTLKSGLFFIKKSLVIPYVYWAFLCFKERDIVNVIKKKFPKSLENKILQSEKKIH